MTGKVRKPNKQQELIAAFLFNPPASRGEWAREVKLASKLIKDHGFDFLISQKGKQKMPSLAWFYTDNGKLFIRDVKSYESMTFDAPKIVLEEQPVAPTTNVEKKPTSLKEFLNIFKYGKT